ncbi:MAG: lytic murein transglycosylase, partial [Shewanella sp.]
MIKMKGVTYVAASLVACVSLSACSSTPSSTAQSASTLAPPQSASLAAPSNQQSLADVIQAHAEAFPTCVKGLQDRARREGLSQDTINTTIAELAFVPKVIELDQQQPEFSQTFANYFSKRATDWRVNEGRRLLKQHRPLLDKLAQQYGVPPQYILSFWGLETNYGSYKGKMSVLDSLATLACEPRRSGYFTTELMQALKLKEKYNFDKQTMVGSWAGAMGHTQFMPST